MSKVRRRWSLVLGMALAVGSLGLSGCSEGTTTPEAGAKGRRDDVQKSREKGKVGEQSPAAKPGPR